MQTGYAELLWEKLFEQAGAYEALKGGDTSRVRYDGYRDKEWGIRDKNAKNRMRLAYYMLYSRIDDEAAVTYLFREECRDRRTNSFQGIGFTLNVLTAILNRYCADGKYDELFEEAKNANFDCACGYDKDYRMCDEIASLDLMDCIFLSQDLDYKDVMEVLVEEWKNGMTEWTDECRTTLIGFYSFLGKEQEKEALYKELLENAVRSGNNLQIVSAYNKVVRYYIDRKQFETARFYLQEMITKTNLKAVWGIRLFDKALEACLEIICGDPKEAPELWKWAKPYLQKRTDRYGNLYTKGIAAAKCVGDPYAAQLEQEYLSWKAEISTALSSKKP